MPKFNAIIHSMKIFITILFTVLAFGNAWAQEEAEPVKLQTEIGIQTNALFGRLVNGSDNGLEQNPYLLTGKLVMGNLAIRAGIGGQYDKQVDRVDGFANTTTTLKQRLDLRLGVERRMSLGDRWQGSLGLDVVAGWTQDKTIEDSGFDVITDTHDLQYLGGGLAAGVKYQVTKRLSFGTEAYLYYTFGNLTDGEFFKNFPVGEDKIQKSDVSNLKVGLPAALYLILEF
jgi:hypothetical protein